MELQVKSLEERFRENLIELSAVLEHLGYTILPYQTPSLENFSSLTPLQKQEVSTYLNVYLSILKSEYLCADFNEDRLLIQFLFRIGCVPTSDISDIIKDQKYIQIYSRSQFQIYRSLSCFEYCSFTLEQLTTRPWFNLWKRDSLFHFACLGLASTALNIIRFTKIRLDFPFHRVTEIDSFNTISFDYRIKSLTALIRQGQLQAALLIEEWK